MDDVPIRHIIVYFIVLILYGIISGNLIAIDNLNEGELEKKAKEGHRRSARLLDICQSWRQFSRDVEFVMIIVSVFMGIYVIRGISLADSLLNTVLICVAATLVLLILGSALPKMLAMKFSEQWAYGTVSIMLLVMTIFKPFIWLINVISRLLARIFGVDPKALSEVVTEEEIISMVSEGHEQGILEESEAEMIHNIFELNDKQASDIMTHRKNIEGIDVSTPLKEAALEMAKGRFSRYPVFEEDLDNIIGILHLKDVMRAYIDRTYDLGIRKLMREPYFVPESQNVDDLFKDMQKKKAHMAIVIDEYGQTDGLVAMEDILEEIVGNILDEYDVDENFIQDMADGTYLMKGLTPLEHIEDLLDIKFEEDEFDTLNGLITSKLERIPADDENASITYASFLFEVLAVENNMIATVRVTPVQLENVEDEEGLED